MIVPRRSLYGAVSDGRVLGFFIPLPPAVLTGIPRKQTFRWKRVLAEFLSAVFFGFHSRYQSTLIPVPPSIRP